MLVSNDQQMSANSRSEEDTAKWMLQISRLTASCIGARVSPMVGVGERSLLRSLKSL